MVWTGCQNELVTGVLDAWERGRLSSAPRTLTTSQPAGRQAPGRMVRVFLRLSTPPSPNCSVRYSSGCTVPGTPYVLGSTLRYAHGLDDGLSNGLSNELRRVDHTSTPARQHASRTSHTAHKHAKANHPRPCWGLLCGSHCFGRAGANNGANATVNRARPGGSY